jgi:hypothetical protein
MRWYSGSARRLFQLLSRSIDIGNSVTGSSQHREHGEVGSNRPQPSPPTSPPVDDQPVQQPQGNQDEDRDTEEISNAIHHLVNKSAKDTRLPHFPLFMLP